MVVPEKLLMKKIKKREKAKKHLAAIKQQSQTKVETENSVEEEQSRKFCETRLFPLIGSAKLCFSTVEKLPFSCVNIDVPGQFVRLNQNNQETNKRKAETEADSAAQKPKKSKLSI